MKGSVAIVAIIAALLVGAVGGYYVAGLSHYLATHTVTVVSPTTYVTTVTSPVTTTVTSTITSTSMATVTVPVTTTLASTTTSTVTSTYTTTATVTSTTTSMITTTSTVTSIVPVTTTVTSTVTVTPTSLRLCNETLVSYELIYQSPGGFEGTNYTLDYPGYLEIIVHNSTTQANLFAVAGESSNGVYYYTEPEYVGAPGNVTFPVLPGIVYVYIGNNASESVTMLISIIYYYYAPSCVSATTAAISEAATTVTS